MRDRTECDLTYAARLAEIERRGFPADMQVFQQDFLTSSSTLQRLQELSVALFRSATFTLAVLRSDTRLLDGTLQLGDDFDANTRIRSARLASDGRPSTHAKCIYQCKSW